MAKSSVAFSGSDLGILDAERHAKHVQNGIEVVAHGRKIVMVSLSNRQSIVLSLCWLCATSQLSVAASHMFPT